tara:strand:+ start:870 stop:1004 length:135 start_codon:yes stop_codon:yes gene_type:complete
MFSIKGIVNEPTGRHLNYVASLVFPGGADVTKERKRKQGNVYVR